MKRSRNSSRWTLVAFGSVVLVAGCCKETPEETAPPVTVPQPVATEKVLAPVGAGTPAAPTPTAASTDDYQSNGFPAVMPKTRTPAPNVAEWGRAPTITTKKFPDGCSMKFVREWLKINCSKDTNTATPLRITGITGFGSEGADFFKFESSGKVLDVVVRTKDGKKGSALFVTDRGSYRVGYDWPYRAPFPSTVFQ